MKLKSFIQFLKEDNSFQINNFNNTIEAKNNNIALFKKNGIYPSINEFISKLNGYDQLSGTTINFNKKNFVIPLQNNNSLIFTFTDNDVAPNIPLYMLNSCKFVYANGNVVEFPFRDTISQISGIDTCVNGTLPLCQNTIKFIADLQKYLIFYKNIDDNRANSAFMKAIYDNNSEIVFASQKLAQFISMFGYCQDTSENTSVPFIMLNQ